MRRHRPSNIEVSGLVIDELPDELRVLREHVLYVDLVVLVEQTTSLTVSPVALPGLSFTNHRQLDSADLLQW